MTERNGFLERPGERDLLHGLLLDRKDSSKTALVSPERDLELSYADLYRDSMALAPLLRLPSGGERPRVALLLPASPEFAAALFAVSAAGGVAVPLDTYSKREELLAVLRYLDPAVVVTSASLKRRFEGSLGEPPACVVERGRNGLAVAVAPPPAAREGGQRPPGPAAVAAPSPEDDAVFIMTSGTTGRPKAVRLSHRAVRNNIDMHLESLGLEGDVVSLQVTPVNYSYGLVAALLSAFRLHGTVVLTPYVIEPRLIHALVDHYGANLFMGTPTIFQYLLEKGGDDLRPLRPLRDLTIGGDRCRPHVAALIRRSLPWTRAFVTYGLSEAGPRVSTLPPQHFESLCTSVGLPLRGVELAVLDDGGRRCAAGEMGEVVLRTPSLMNGYFRDEARTADRVRDGWLFTRDLGRIDENGFLHLAGRRDREFKYRGRLVNPVAIEQVFSRHPHVEEAHVTRAEDGRGEFIVATVKASDGAPGQLEREFKALCRRRLPTFLVPAEFRFYEPGVYLFKGKPGKQIAQLPQESRAPSRNEPAPE